MSTGSQAGISERTDRTARAIVLLIVGLVLVAIPLKILDYGYFPPDDVRRHAAKVVSGKAWEEVLVLKSDIGMHSHTGWHSLLSVVQSAASLNVEELMVFSIVGLFLLYAFTPALMARFPEAWLLVLSILSVADPRLLKRLLQGRPYIVTMIVILLIAFTWKRLAQYKPDNKIHAALVLAIAVSVWMHGSWYLFGLPFASFVLAGELRAARRFGYCALVGILLGAALTGSPVALLEQVIVHALRIFGEGEGHSFLVEEFRPFDGDRYMLIAVLGFVAWRYMRGAWDIKSVKNPVFILGVMGWIFAFYSKRFWFDLGVPALSVWMIAELGDAFADLKQRQKLASGSRIGMALVFGTVLFLSFTNDLDRRWTKATSRSYLDFDEPKLKEFVGEGGGIIYNSHMDVFYDTFRKNPHAPWRYMVGFEAAMMPDEDVKVYRYLRASNRSEKGFRRWAKKMTPEDLMIIRKKGGSSSTKPGIKELKWMYARGGYWIGKL